MDERDLKHLGAAVALAREGLEADDEPFGSVLVTGDGEVGLGRIVYASSSEQLSRWLQEWGAPQAPVRPLPVQDVAPQVAVEGPDPELAEEVRQLHLDMWHRRGLSIG